MYMYTWYENMYVKTGQIFITYMYMYSIFNTDFEIPALHNSMRVHVYCV